MICKNSSAIIIYFECFVYEFRGIFTKEIKELLIKRDQEESEQRRKFDCEYYDHHSYYGQRVSQATALCFIISNDRSIPRLTKGL